MRREVAELGRQVQLGNIFLSQQGLNFFSVSPWADDHHGLSVFIHTGSHKLRFAAGDFQDTFADPIQRVDMRDIDQHPDGGVARLVGRGGHHWQELRKGGNVARQEFLLRLQVAARQVKLLYTGCQRVDLGTDFSQGDGFRWAGGCCPGFIAVQGLDKPLQLGNQIPGIFLALLGFQAD